jgi:WD40 repeat protein
MKIKMSVPTVSSIRRSVVCLALGLFTVVKVLGQAPKLEFVKQIGPGFDIDKWGWMSFVAFNADGTQIASDAAISRKDMSQKLSIWTFADGRLVKQLHERPIAISLDWKYYASYHGVFETATDRSLIAFPDDHYVDFIFSPDSRYVAENVAGMSARGRHIRLVELLTGKTVSAFGKHVAFAFAISPDGKVLASGHWDAVVLWSIPTGTRIASFHGFKRYVKSLSFSPDGRMIATGDDLGGLQLWDVQRSKRVFAVSPAPSIFHSAQFF